MHIRSDGDEPSPHAQPFREKIAKRPSYLAKRTMERSEYFTDAGQAMKTRLISAGLGLEHYLDLRADEADVQSSKITGGTPRTHRSPLYVAGCA
ncbi:hypothetical protein FQR65_LT20772 [Abscondita terminalis]|nr:hypothetical protein FQR65_LT20772 [Abscondita terminalis]